MDVINIDGLFRAVTLAAPFVVSAYFVLHPAAASFLAKTLVFMSAMIGIVGYCAGALGLQSLSHLFFVLYGLFQFKQ